LKRGIFFTHQGWTDIVNCLGLVGYYSKRYDQLLVLVREDSKDFMDFYLQQFNNVEPRYEKKEKLSNLKLEEFSGFDLLFHGESDKHRVDTYRGVFSDPKKFFVKRFYENYDIDYSVKIDDFGLKRDIQLENEIYEDFLLKYKSNYILYHDDSNTPGGSTGISIPNEITEDKRSINLNGITSNFFKFIKVIENAVEIHLVDSVWASVIYHLDTKYRIFDQIPIYIYPFKIRHGGLIDYKKSDFLEPIHPGNWIIKKI
jgi:hypothetical protein